MLSAAICYIKHTCYVNQIRGLPFMSMLPLIYGAVPVLFPSWFSHSGRGPAASAAGGGGSFSLFIHMCVCGAKSHSNKFLQDNYYCTTILQGIVGIPEFIFHCVTKTTCCLQTICQLHHDSYFFSGGNRQRVAFPVPRISERRRCLPLSIHNPPHLCGEADVLHGDRNGTVCPDESTSGTS